MVTTFPLCEQPVNRGCVYFDTNEIYQQLTNELNRSILVMAEGNNRNGGGTVTNVRYFLASTFGGRYMDYTVKKYASERYLITLPIGLDKNEVITRGSEWGATEEWTFHHWRVDEDAYYQPKRFNVRLMITNFPLDFWDISFIRQMVSEFGEVTSIDDQYITGVDRTCIKLWMKCIDPRRIPPASVLPYATSWKECYIRVVDWNYNVYVPEVARLTSLDQRHMHAEFGRHPDIPRLSLIIANDRIQNYWSSPNPPSPPYSPPYPFSDLSDSEIDLEMPPSETIPNTMDTSPVLATDNPLTYCTTQADNRGDDTAWTNATNNNCAISENLGRWGTIQVGLVSILVQQNTHAQRPMPKACCRGDVCSLINRGVGRQDASKKELHTNYFSPSQPTSIKVGEITVFQTTTGPTHINATQQPQKEQPLETTNNLPNPSSQKKSPLQIGTHLVWYEINELQEPQQGLQKSGGPLERIYSGPLSAPDWAANPHTDHSRPLNHTTQPPKLEPNKQNTQSTLKTHQHHSSKMALSDDEFIARFAALSSPSETPTPLQLPNQTIEARDFSLCVLARVLTERTTVENQFSSNMIRAWGANTKTSVTAISRNHYLIQFDNEQDLNRAMYKGVWNFRGDIVILKRHPTQSDLSQPEVMNMETWIQLHNIPAGTITTEGIRLLAGEIGEPITEPTAAFIDGNKYYKIKLLIPITKSLKEILYATHQHIGTITIHVVYERLIKICLFCGIVGHEYTDCPDKTRMDALARDPKYATMPGMNTIAALKIQPWVNNVALIPRPQAQTPLRRSGPTNQQGEGERAEQADRAGEAHLNRPRRRSINRGCGAQIPNPSETSDQHPIFDITKEGCLLQLGMPGFQSEAETSQAQELTMFGEQIITQYAPRGNNMVPVQENLTNKRRAVEANRNSSPPDQ